MVRDKNGTPEALLIEIKNPGCVAGFFFQFHKQCAAVEKSEAGLT
jgi:hypothetical protein